MKLIKAIDIDKSISETKLNQEHFIIVDENIELKENDYAYNSLFNKVVHLKKEISESEVGFQNLLSEINKMQRHFKITHSTHCLNCGSYDFSSDDKGYGCDDCNSEWTYSEYKAFNLFTLKNQIPSEYLNSTAPGKELEIEFTTDGLKTKNLI